MPDILVAEDDATTREMIRGILKKEGYDVSIAADGMSALRILKKKKIDLVLLDIWMPKMTGLGLIGVLHGEQHIPKIIVMTSDKTSDTVLNSLRGHVYQFLPKPIDANTLISMVDNALSEDPSIPPIEVLSANKHSVEFLLPSARSLPTHVPTLL